MGTVMGRVRTHTIKKASETLIENNNDNNNTHYQKLTHDFAINKRVIDSVTEIRSKGLRNRIAGFTTFLIKRRFNGSVSGVANTVQALVLSPKDIILSQSDTLPLYLKVDYISVDKCT